MIDQSRTAGVTDGGSRLPSVRRAYPPARMGWREYAEAVASALEIEHAPRAAAALRQCGRMVRVWHCQHCGGENAVHMIGCGIRACAHCERKAASDTFPALERAMATLPAMVAPLAAATLAKAPAEIERAERLMRTWMDRARIQRERGLDALADRSLRHVRNAIAQRKRWRRWRVEAKRVDSWQLRMVVIAEQWRPEDPSEWTIDAMRRRAKRIIATWRAVFRELRVGGAAQYVAALEMSERGHVHLHVLYFGPYLAARPTAEGQVVSWLTEVGRAANKHCGKIVVRKTYGRGAKIAREAIKYTLKGGAAGDPLWIAGQPRPVPHPTAAARWHIALHRMQRITYSRALRLAMQAAPDVEPDLSCRHCKGELPASHLWDSVYADTRARDCVARTTAGGIRDGPGFRAAVARRWRDEVRTRTATNG